MHDASDDRPPIAELRRRYEEERFDQDDRAAGQHACALSVRLRESGEVREYAASVYAWHGLCRPRAWTM
jgi:hypothetical protein